MPTPVTLRRHARLATALCFLAPATMASAQAVVRGTPPGGGTGGAPAAPPAVPPTTLDATLRRQIADSVAFLLARFYPDSAIGARLAEVARARGRAAGAPQVPPEAFAADLMRDLQQVVPDKHLRLVHDPRRDYGMLPGGGPRPSSGSATWNRIDGRDSAEIARTNFAFDRVERLEGNVGYLKLNRFVPPDYARSTAVAAMAFLANSEAMIVDLRSNVGGSPELVELLLSYFLPAEPQVLLTTYDRATGGTVERRSLRDVPGRRMTDVPLFVLTDGNSASAAEMFAYVGRRTGRAVVVGETTAGAGQGGAQQSVGGGLALFVPRFRVVDGPGYERTGVAPHVAVPADSALVVAHRAALDSLSVRTPGRARELAWTRELVERTASPHAVTASQLERYAGEYGARRFEVRGGHLVAVGSTGWATRLVPTGAHEFRGPTTRMRFEVDGAGHAVALVVEPLAGAVVRSPRGPAASASTSASTSAATGSPVAGAERVAPPMRRSGPSEPRGGEDTGTIPTRAGSDLASHDDEFTTPASLARWTSFQRSGGWADMLKRAEVRDGELVLEPWTSGWYEDFHAPFLHRTVRGDFVATARVRAEGANGGTPRTPWSLAGLMVRAPRDVTPATWTPGGENWLFLTTGVAEQPERAVFETKTTVQSASRLRLHPSRTDWVELRIVRRGATFELAARFDGEAWSTLERFERPDMPDAVQVGFNAYTDWYHARSLHGDPKAFNTTLLTDGRPDLRFRVDWVRFAPPPAAAPGG